MCEHHCAASSISSGRGPVPRARTAGQRPEAARGGGGRRDARPGRTEWLAANPAKPAVSKKGNRMKNSEKLAASKKKPAVPYYLEGSSRVVFKRE